MANWTDDQSPARDVSINLQPSPYSGHGQHNVTAFTPLPVLTPDQDHALRTAAVWEQRRWEAIGWALKGYMRMPAEAIVLLANKRGISAAQCVVGASVELADQLIAAARQKEREDT